LAWLSAHWTDLCNYTARATERATEKKNAIFPRKHSSLDIGMFGCIDVNQPMERSPEVWHIRPETPCTYV